MIGYSVVLCVCCRSVLLGVLVDGLSLVHGLSSRSFWCIVRMYGGDVRSCWLLVCVVWHSGRGIYVERYMIIELESISEISYPRRSFVYECQRFTSPVIIEFGMLVVYCMQFVMSVSVVSCLVFLGAMYILAMVMSLKCFVCILRSCMSVLMTCGVLICVNVVSELRYVMRLTPCLCSLSVQMAVKCGICGVLDAEVSFDFCIVMMSGCVVCMRCLSSSTVLPLFRVW